MGAVAMTIGAVMPADLAIDVLEKLEGFAARKDRECEVILRPDGSGEIMASERTRTEYALRGESAEAFASIARFDTIAELVLLLEVL
jgi:hypothetical protein